MVENSPPGSPRAEKARPLVAEPMLNRACSTGAEVDGLQDATSENGVERAKVSQREPHRGGVEPGEYHLRSVSDFLHAVLPVAVATSREGQRLQLPIAVLKQKRADRGRPARLQA